MVGRFIGAAVMQKFDAGKALTFNAICSAILIMVTLFTSGSIAMWAILLVGLFNSIMFPTIFSLALNGLEKHTSQGAGILCLAIVGGATFILLFLYRFLRFKRVQSNQQNLIITIEVINQNISID